MPHRVLPFAWGLLLLALPLVVQAEPATDPGAAFAGQPGTLVLRWPDGRLWRHDPQRAAERFSPCSSFKIPNALIGLDSGVIPGPDFVLPWDGQSRSWPDWNRDHDLRGAIRYSVVWYFQELARRVGTQRMQAYLDRLDYGNRDISGGIDRFWLGSSLKISAEEQVEFLTRLHAERLPLAPASQRQVKQMLALAEKGGAVLSGKTGSWRPDGGRWSLGWFVGWLERQGQVYIFACRLEADPTREAHGGRAREVAEAVLGAWGLW